MNRLEEFLEEIKELSDIDTINGAQEMQDRLEDIHDLVENFMVDIFDIGSTDEDE